VERTRGGRREPEEEAGRSVDQSPLELLAEVVKGLGARLDVVRGQSEELLEAIRSHESLRPDEVLELRNFVKETLPQIQEILENRRNQKWFWKRVGLMFVGGPALVTMGAALWQLGIKLIEWIRSQ
jgi:hypothetical protein